MRRLVDGQQRADRLESLHRSARRVRPAEGRKHYPFRPQRAVRSPPHKRTIRARILTFRADTSRIRPKGRVLFCTSRGAMQRATCPGGFSFSAYAGCAALCCARRTSQSQRPGRPEVAHSRAAAWRAAQKPRRTRAAGVRRNGNVGARSAPSHGFRCAWTHVRSTACTRRRLHRRELRVPILRGLHGLSYRPARVRGC